jgi:hypothetical protein
MPLSFTPLFRLKRCHVCDQCHASRVSTASYRYHCKLRPNAEGTYEEAELACQTLGGGAHLGSLTDEAEKWALNSAFKSDISTLTDVWFGLTNWDMYVEGGTVPFPL